MSDNKIVNTSAGVASGFFLYKGFNHVVRKFGGKCIENALVNKMTNFSADERVQIREAISKTLTSKTFAQKEIHIVNLTPQNLGEESVKKLINEYATKHMEGFISTAKGKNGFCLPPKTVIVNMEKTPGYVFHELGHVINRTKRGFSNAISRLRSAPRILIPAMLFASLLSPKREGEPKNSYEKAGDFCRKNAGWFVASTRLPILIEEGMASINAAKLARATLSPSIAKRINKANVVAFCSYMLSTIAIGVGTQYALWLKDKLTARKPRSQILYCNTDSKKFLG